jgi:peptidyl-prolyl cis-trans isomerase SurA
MRKIFLPLILSGLLYATVYEGVAIVVKDKAITLLEIKSKMAELNSDAKNAADALIRQKLEELEIQERKITVDSSEVYDDIKKAAARNNMNVSEFYEAVRNSNGMNSTEFKEKMKQKLLSQKLYSAIAYAEITEPSEADVKEYYKLHKEKYKHPSEFTVVVYVAKDKERLQEKIDNPMFDAPDIQTNEQVLPYERISPELSSLLEKTEPNHFTPVVPDGKNGHMSFYVKAKKSVKESSLESVKNEIINSIMEDKRETVLSNYFARLRQNVVIETLRMPE